MSKRVATLETRNLLIKFCGLLGSDFEGERAAAALKLSRLLAEIGLCWDEILTVPQPATVDILADASKAATDDGVSGQQTGCRSGPIFADWRADLACCQRHRSLLSRADREYVEGLLTISETERTVVRASDNRKLAGIARRVRKQVSLGRRATWEVRASN